MKKSKKKKKFFGHRMCNTKCVRGIPSPLKAYAAMLIDTEGLGEEEMITDMKQTYEKGGEQNRLKIGLNDTAEWMYIKNERSETNINKTVGGSTGGKHRDG